MGHPPRRNEHRQPPAQLYPDRRPDHGRTVRVAAGGRLAVSSRKLFKIHTSDPPQADHYPLFSNRGRGGGVPPAPPRSLRAADVPPPSVAAGSPPEDTR